MKKIEIIIPLSLLTALLIASCSDNTTKQVATNSEAGKTMSITKTSKILSKPKRNAKNKVSPVALAADMKTVERLLNEWSSGYDSDNKQYTENTYRMLMLARTLLTNTHMFPEHRIRIIDEYNRTQLRLDYLPINMRTNDKCIAGLIRDKLYWPYPTYGALFLVLNNIVNDNNVDEYTKAQAYIRLAQINHYFYRHSEEAEFYLNAFSTYPVEMEEDRQLTLNKIGGAQFNIWDEHERVSILKKAIDGIHDTYDKSSLKIALCEAYTRCGKYDHAQEVFDEIRQSSTVNNNNQLNKLEKCILEKKPIYRKKRHWGYTGKSINEIPNIRIDWQAFSGRDVDSFKQYFGALLDELINAEQNK